MRIIALNRFYRPDHSATSQMLTDLAEYLAGEGHSVTVITSRLRYDGGGGLAPREQLAGVDVRRVWTTQFGRRKLAGRAIDYAAFYISAFIELLKAGRKGDLVIAKTDPPLISVVAALAGRVKGMALVNWCQDLFPEVAGALGMTWAGGWAGRRLKALRNWSLRQATFNAVLHETMAERLAGDGIVSERIRILPNWADADIRPVPHRANPLREEWGLGDDKFVIGYSGNLGRAHMPQMLAALVAATKHIEGLVWLFIGGGAGLEAVKATAASADNVLFKPYQPRDRLSQSLSAPDIHLISLDPACEGYIVPSKLYGIRAAGRPVLFLGDPDGAVAREIGRYGAGEVLDPSLLSSEAAAAKTAALVSEQRGARGMPNAWTHDWTASKALQDWSSELSRCRVDDIGAALSTTSGSRRNDPGCSRHDWQPK